MFRAHIIKVYSIASALQIYPKVIPHGISWLAKTTKQPWVYIQCPSDCPSIPQTCKLIKQHPKNIFNHTLSHISLNRSCSQNKGLHSTSLKCKANQISGRASGLNCTLTNESQEQDQKMALLNLFTYEWNYFPYSEVFSEKHFYP